MAAALCHYPFSEVGSWKSNVLFIGEENIGKSTFIRTYCNHIRDNEKVKIKEDSFSLFAEFKFDYFRNGRLIPIRLLDLPAGTTEKLRRDQFPTSIDLIVFCFAVDKPTSFARVFENWLPEIRQEYGYLPGFYLLGLRNDLTAKEETPGPSMENRIPVTLDADVQQEFSKHYMECSAMGDPRQAIYWMNMIIDRVCYLRRNPEK